MAKKKGPFWTEWHEVTNAEAHQVTGSTATPGLVFRYDPGKLPAQIQKLPGLYDSYISGHVTRSISPENVTVLGEVAAVREDGGIGKGYIYLFGLSGSHVYINGPYKNFPEHHFNDTGSIPVDKLFGNVPAYPQPLMSIPVGTASLAPARVPEVSKTVRVRFALHEPGAKKVFLCGNFNGWALDTTPMQRPAGNFTWEANVELAPGRYEYKFVVDGLWKEDPLATENSRNPYGTLNSVIHV